MGVVYVVTSGEYSDYHIDGVFTDYDKAELYRAILHDKDKYDYCNPQIEEYNTDEIQVEGKVYRGLLFREVTGKRRNVDSIHTFVSTNPIEEKVKTYTNCFGEKIIAVTTQISKRVNADEAKKIAYDWLAKYKAEGQGL